MKKRLSGSFYNLTTLTGMSIAILMLVLIVALILLDALRGFSNAYMGLITYIGLPGIMIFSVLVAYVGVVRARKRALKGDADQKVYPTIDLNSSRTRKLVTYFALGGIVVMTLSGFGTLQAYEYTESVKFCGETCHFVMGPEYTAYQNSPHAKVPCKQCHIGPGAQSYVQSKLSGSYQLYAALTGTYKTPIPTPVRNLRSSKDTCEQCHWTSQIYAPKMRTRVHYLADDTNTAYQMSMLVKVGTTEPGKDEGIHAHMYLNNQVTYIASDPQRQVIPYVEMRDKAGNVTIYRSKELPIDDATIKTAERQIVNCTDCHNRPTHQFPHPDVTLNDAFSRHLLDASIPELKTAATEALEGTYKTQAEGLAGVESSLRKFYEKNHPEVLAKNHAGLEQAIQEIRKIYARSYFPEMKADWKAHPDNLDHIHSNGCFRCHDDKHVSPQGKVISKNCQTCHLIVAQGNPGTTIPANLKGVDFKHPVDIGDEWKTTPCKDCHGKQEEDKK